MHPTQPDTAGSEQPADQGATESAASPGSGHESGAAPTEAERLRQERDQVFAQLQRAQADYQNLRRRALTDLESSLRRALEPLLQNLLLVLDNLDLACGAEASSEDARGLLSGVRLTRDQLLRSLELEGVSPIPDGGSFDPARHLAVLQQPTPGPAGQVVATLRRGYTWKTAVLRAAQVAVSTPAAPAEASPGTIDTPAQ